MLKFAVLGLCVCGVFSWGSCPEFKPIDNFNLTAFLGTWHEIERYPNQYEILSSCVVSDYKVTGEDDSGKISDFMRQRIKKLFVFNI